MPKHAPEISVAPPLKRRSLGQMARHSAINARDRILKADALNQAGRSEFEVIERWDIVSLRHYPALPTDAITVQGESLSVAKTDARIPLVIVPPLAVNMLIYDLFEQRSLVRYLRACGFDLYLIDWGRPSRRHDRLHLEDYIQRLLPQALAEVRAHSGQQELSLHGWSLGGLFSYCYAALGDPDIRNIVLLGAPCDYHAEGGANWQNRFVSRQMKRVQRLTRFRPHGTQQRWWRAPGWANSLAFKLASPAGTVKGYSELFRQLHDRDFVAGHATNSAFLNDMVAYPGGVVQDIVQYLLTENRLAEGRLPLPDCEADLSRIKANILLLVGKQDPIVPPRSSQRILELASSADKTMEMVPGGHMSIVSGSRAPAECWPLIRDWLRPRSQ